MYNTSVCVLVVFQRRGAYQLQNIVLVYGQQGENFQLNNNVRKGILYGSEQGVFV